MPQLPHRLRNDLKYVEWDVKPYYTHCTQVGSSKGNPGQGKDTNKMRKRE